MPPLPWLVGNDPEYRFPDVTSAFRDPNGLLAAGGDLAAGRLLEAYRRGIFPWYGPGEPILWWSPDPRAVIDPRQPAVSRRLARTLRSRKFRISYDAAFAEVVAACARPRRPDDGTWIMPEMAAAYVELHRRGHAHSIEVWHDARLVGGLYGVAVGAVFSGESMFSRVSDASKVALVQLCRRLAEAGYAWLDCQVMSPHIERMGAIRLARAQFLKALPATSDPETWRPRWPAP